MRSRFFFGRDSGNPGNSGIGNGITIIIICVCAGFGGGTSNRLKINISGCQRIFRRWGGSIGLKLEIIQEIGWCCKKYSRTVVVIFCGRHLCCYFGAL